MCVRERDRERERERERQRVVRMCACARARVSVCVCVCMCECVCVRSCVRVHVRAFVCARERGQGPHTGMNTDSVTFDMDRPTHEDQHAIDDYYDLNYNPATDDKPFSSGLIQ